MVAPASRHQRRLKCEPSLPLFVSHPSFDLKSISWADAILLTLTSRLGCCCCCPPSCAPLASLALSLEPPNVMESGLGVRCSAWCVHGETVKYKHKNQQARACLPNPPIVFNLPYSMPYRPYLTPGAILVQSRSGRKACFRQTGYGGRCECRPLRVESR